MMTCRFHGENPRPERCYECSRLDPERKSGKIQLRPEDVGTLERTTDWRGRVAFRVREGRTLERGVPHGWDRI